MPATKNVFRVVCLLTSSLYLYLFVHLLVSPATLCADFGPVSGAAFDFLARRVSALMLAFGVLLILVRNLQRSPSRQAIAFAVGLNMTGFAISGTTGLICRVVHPSVIVPTLVETVVAIVWFSFVAMDYRPRADA